MSGWNQTQRRMIEYGNGRSQGAVGDYKEGWHDPEHSTIRFDSGLSEEAVEKFQMKMA